MKKKVKWILLVVILIVGIIKNDLFLISYAQEHLNEETTQYFLDKLNEKEKSNIEADLECRQRIKDLTQTTDHAYSQLFQKRRDYEDLFEINTNQKKEIDNLKKIAIILFVSGVIIGYVIRDFL